jgi:hypothetical protein
MALFGAASAALFFVMLCEDSGNSGCTLILAFFWGSVKLESSNTTCLQKVQRFFRFIGKK